MTSDKTALKIGVFGCGNMGKALVQGMHARFADIHFFLYTPGVKRAQDLAGLVNGTHVVDILEMPRDLDWYFLAFKPQNLENFHFDFNPNSKIMSVLAAVKTTQLMSKFNVKKIARLMPNTPSAIGEGANLLFFNDLFESQEIGELNSLLSATGSLFLMKTELDLDLTTAFSGSGPALLFEMARIFEAELNRMTEGRVDARAIVTKTFFGSSALMKNEFLNDPHSQKSFEELRNQVTSTKGVTYEALEVLKNSKVQSIFSLAFEAAYKRTLELSQ